MNPYLQGGAQDSQAGATAYEPRLNEDKARRRVKGHDDEVDDLADYSTELPRTSGSPKASTPMAGPGAKALLASVKQEKKQSLVAGVLLFGLAMCVRFYGISYPDSVV